MNAPASAKRTLGEGRFVRLVAQDHWEWAERKRVSGAVVIIAATPEREIVLVEQYRIPLGRPTIEPPAGLAGDTEATHGEELRVAAERELLEETGFVSDDWEYLLEGPSSAGLADEVYTMFLVRNARRVAPGGGDGQGHEQIVVHVIPLDEAEAWLDERRRAGAAVDPKIYAGLYFLLTRL